MRFALTLLVPLLFSACAPAPPPPQQPVKDPTTEPWYAQTIDQLTAQTREATELFTKGKADQAAALVQSGEKLSTRLLAVPEPTLAAVEAASDVDELYGKMLFSNHNYGWARLFFQKNVARWKHVKQETPETASRLKRAQTEIDQVDAQMTK